MSADAAARLARLEALVSEQNQALQDARRQMDKASLRYKLYSAEFKRPMQQVLVRPNMALRAISTCI